ncbi:MAG TPA: polysaccharide deacetylase family protein, partial [Chloroflexota bacterium]|nr:polysaccharide deacetylase family protein [Chloroflexota bacterium]
MAAPPAGLLLLGVMLMLAGYVQPSAAAALLDRDLAMTDAPSDAVDAQMADQTAAAQDDASPATTADAAVNPTPLPPVPTATPAPTPKPGTVTSVPILMYHYIRTLPPNTPDQLGYGLSIAPPLFEQELAYLQSAGYKSVAMDDVVARITRGTPLPPKPVVLSFDDGYADFYTAAWPLLKKYGFSATAYIVIDFLGRPGYMSWQDVQELRDAGVEIG